MPPAGFRSSILAVRRDIGPAAIFQSPLNLLLCEFHVRLVFSNQEPFMSNTSSTRFGQTFYTKRKI